MDVWMALFLWQIFFLGLDKTSRGLENMLRWFGNHSLPINAWFWGYYALIVLLWEVHSSLAIAREQCFPKQHYESIVPENQALKGLVHHYSRKYCTIIIYGSCIVFDVILNDKGHNSVEQIDIVPDNSDWALLCPQAPLL